MSRYFFPTFTPLLCLMTAEILHTGSGSSLGCGVGSGPAWAERFVQRGDAVAETGGKLGQE